MLKIHMLPTSVRLRLPWTHIFITVYFYYHMHMLVIDQSRFSSDCYWKIHKYLHHFIHLCVMLFSIRGVHFSRSVLQKMNGWNMHKYIKDQYGCNEYPLPDSGGRVWLSLGAHLSGIGRVDYVIGCYGYEGETQLWCQYCTAIAFISSWCSKERSNYICWKAKWMFSKYKLKNKPPSHSRSSSKQALRR